MESIKRFFEPVNGFILRCDLGMKWEIPTFVVALVATLLLANKFGGRFRILWLLPALVLYFGVFWEIPSPYMEWFKWAFWGAFIVAFIWAFRDKVTVFAQLPLKLIAGLIAILLVMMLWVVVSGQVKKDVRAFDTSTKVTDVCDTLDGEPNSRIQDELPMLWTDDGKGNCFAQDSDSEEDQGDLDLTEGDVLPEGGEYHPDRTPVECTPYFTQQPGGIVLERDEIDWWDQVARRKSMRILAQHSENLADVYQDVFDRNVREPWLVDTNTGDCLSAYGRGLLDDLRQYDGGVEEGL